MRVRDARRVEGRRGGRVLGRGRLRQAALRFAYGAVTGMTFSGICKLEWPRGWTSVVRHPRALARAASARVVLGVKVDAAPMRAGEGAIVEGWVGGYARDVGRSEAEESVAEVETGRPGTRRAGVLRV